MNDNLELHWFQDKLKSHLEKSIKYRGIELTHSPILDRLYTILSNNPLTIYLSSFSKENDCLSQWRAYANNGKGVSLGFDFNGFPFEQGTVWPSGEIEESTGYCDVIYDKEEQEKHIVAFEEIFFKNADVIHNELGNEPDNKLSVLAAKIFSYSGMFKNPAFREENEVRIIHMPHHIKGVGWKGAFSDIQFKNSEGKLISFFEMSFRSSIVQSITLGPKCECDEQELNLFLISHGYDNVKIYRSAASYR
ncbi:hypothetical protein AKG98_3183 [Moritella sp. JT01]|uniref:DUF2971 domain-containing protein n=1 Tax=Moritella sp. JT01 TaxID=756698 RepID=UPI0007977BD6|nr:DUF2971 domain-containing protein [Moritella sp. JT01]KXO06444.1 hypothetical protein AKG98_3183 [Moritella sp. JT01]